MCLRIVLVDDHEAVRNGVRLLCEHAGIDIVAEATTVAEAVETALQQESDLILLDITLPDGDGFEVLRRVKEVRRELPVLIYSLHDDSFRIRRSMALGASGYVAKDSGAESLLSAMRWVAQGGSYWNGNCSK